MANSNFIKAVHPKGYAKKSTITNPFTCPKCKTVYSQSDPISECRFCNWKNKKYDKSIEEDTFDNLEL